MTSQNIGLKACDKNDVMEAVRQDGRALEYASEELKGDCKFLEDLKNKKVSVSGISLKNMIEILCRIYSTKFGKIKHVFLRWVSL